MATTSMGFSCARPCRALSVLASTLLLVAAFLCSCCAALKPQQLRGYGVSDRGFISAVERPDDKSIEQHLGTQRASQDFVKAYLVSLTYSVHSTKMTWEQADKTCRDRTLRLPTAATWQDLDVLRKLCPLEQNPEGCWLSPQTTLGELCPYTVAGEMMWGSCARKRPAVCAERSARVTDITVTRTVDTLTEEVWREVVSDAPEDPVDPNMTRAAQEGEWAPGQATSTEEEEQQSDDGVVLAEYPSDYFSWSETELQTDATSDATPTIPSSTDEWEAVGQARWDDTIVDERESTDADVFEEGEERANDVEWLDQYLDRLWSEWAQAKQSEERGEGEYRIEFEEEEARDANNMAQNYDVYDYADFNENVEYLNPAEILEEAYADPNIYTEPNASTGTKETQATGEASVAKPQATFAPVKWVRTMFSWFAVLDKVLTSGPQGVSQSAPASESVTAQGGKSVLQVGSGSARSSAGAARRLLAAHKHAGSKAAQIARPGKGAHKAASDKAVLGKKHKTVPAVKSKGKLSWKDAFKKGFAEGF